MNGGRFVRCGNVAGWLATALMFFPGGRTMAQTYAPPTNGDFGGNGAFTVSVDTFTNPVYPTANGSTLTVSVFHPNALINPALPTLFFAHGFTSPIGNAADYSTLLTNLASRGYNVVFSPYEGGANPSIAKRFDELTTGFEAAVTNYGLNTAQVGFMGHSYGGGFLPSVILHEMMGQADLFNPGHTWGGTAAFFYSMACGYAYSGGGQTGVSSSQTISFPTNLNVIEQVFTDDSSFADPRLAQDIFYNITTLNSQKSFLAVNGDTHGTPAQAANHFLPNSGITATSLQAWGIFRRMDALAAWTFTGDTTARQLALGNGEPVQTYEGTWSDNVPVAALGVTDLPMPVAFPPGQFVVQWEDAANPRGNFPLVAGPPRISSVNISAGFARLAVSGLLTNHTYTEQSSMDLASGTWRNAINLLPVQTTQTLTNAVGNAPRQFWRIYAP